MLTLNKLIFGFLDFCTPKLLGSIASGVSIISGLSNIFGGGGSGSGGGASSATPGGSVYDPFSTQRPQYQSQLQTLMQNPGSFASSPAYQFAYGQGLNAINRTDAAKGLTGSGNRLYDLMQYGQGLASQMYFPQAALLSNLSGSGQGGFNIAGGGTTQQGWNAVAQGLGGLANSPFFSGSSAGSIDTSGTTDMTGFQTDTWAANPGSSYGPEFNASNLLSGW
ncbi:MAG: hypothetical protein KGL39_10035 [Patescibacteria group bacterium]|nr:hypothetical protein [Patescibacteria group bacterium]